IREIAVKVGDKVSQGTLLARLDAKEKESRSAATNREPAAPEQPVAESRGGVAPVEQEEPEKPFREAPPKSAGGKAPPVEIEEPDWSVDEQQPPIPRKEYGGPTATVPPPRAESSTAPRDADITDLEAFRVALNKEQEVKVTLLAFLMKACVAALQKFPNFNSSLEGDHLVVKKYWNIAFAADTPQGLVVPVVKDADKKGVF